MTGIKDVKRFLFVAIVVLAVTAEPVNCDDTENIQQDVQEEGRTFGHHFLKRMSFAMIPMMYKLGMMTTLLITLTIMSVKGLAVGILLLILAISQIISRTFTVPAAAPVAAVAYQPAVQPVVQYSHVPVVHKTIPHVHAVHGHTHAYAHGWEHGPSPWAREDTGEVEYEKKQ